MKKFSKLIALVLVLSLVFAFTACGKGGSDDTIKLGILCSLTGNSQTNGGYAQQGAKMAVEEINAAGGINGKQIELVIEDDGGKADTAINAYYSMMAAKQGLMGVSMTNAEALVVPTYAREPMFGTNPIAVTIPADPHPFHMDFATSVMTCGKMEVYAKIGHELQPGMLVDETGTTCLDPNVFLRIRDNKSNPAYTEKTRGGIMPMGGEGMLFGGHKGYGLALLVDIMCAVMSHGAVSKGVRVTKDKEKCCHFFAAIDYSLFGDKEETNRRLSEYLQSMRDAEPAEGQSRVYVHGDKEADAEKDVLAHGVGINPATYAEIEKYCVKKGINIKDYLIPEEA